MATQVRYLDTSIEYVVDPLPRPMLMLVHDASNYDDLERTAPGFASRGIHRGVLGGLIGIYAAMLIAVPPGLHAGAGDRDRWYRPRVTGRMSRCACAARR